MMSWLFGHKRKDQTAEIEQIKATADANVEKVAGKRLDLEKVIEQMKERRVNAAGNQ